LGQSPKSLNNFHIAVSALISFAVKRSYAMVNQNAAALALQMGHTSQAMIFSNYREVVTRQDAERYWDIKPARTAANVIPMAAKTG
jgi:hypothetical protein